MIASRVSAEVSFFEKEFLVKYLSRLIVLIVTLFMVSVAWAVPDNAHVAPKVAVQNGTTQLVAPDEGVLSPVATTEQFALGQYTSLWEYAMAQKIPRHEWPAYWKDACVLSGIACTDHAWRKLPVGKVITAPRAANAILTEENARAAKIAALSAQVVASQKKLMMEKEAALRAQFRLMMSSLVFFVMTLIFITTIVIVRRERALAKKARELEIEELKTRHAEHPHTLDDVSIDSRGPVEQFVLPPLDQSPSCCTSQACECGDGDKCCCSENDASTKTCSCGHAAEVAPTLTNTAAPRPSKEPIKLEFKYFPKDTPEKP